MKTYFPHDARYLAREITKVSVTQRHINNGKRNHPTCCPVALALLDAGFVEPHVYGACIQIRKSKHDDHLTELYLSNDLSVFVKAFDVGSPTDPFEFDISL